MEDSNVEVSRGVAPSNGIRGSIRRGIVLESFSFDSSELDGLEGGALELGSPCWDLFHLILPS